MEATSIFKFLNKSLNTVSPDLSTKITQEPEKVFNNSGGMVHTFLLYLSVCVVHHRDFFQISEDF